MDINELQKAILLTKEGKLHEAEKIYIDLLKEESENPILLSAFGLFYVALKNYEKAEEFLKKACELKCSLGSLSALGNAQFEQKKYKETVQSMLSALNYGQNVDIYNKLVLSLFHIGNYQLAIKYAGEMYEKYSENEASVANMVKALTQCGKLIEAEQICVNYLKEHNDSGGLWIHLGFLKELIYADDKQALECFRIASKLGHYEAVYNMAVSYSKMGDFENAEKCYQKMLDNFPNDNETMISLGMLYLKQKKFKKGYDLFFNRSNYGTDKKLLNKWSPNTDFEKEVVVVCDQGYGDHIQFSRYLSYLKQKVEKIFVAGRDALKEIFIKNFPFIEYISYDEIDSNMQAIRITDLAYALGIDFENIPSKEGYLKSETENITSDKLKVGLCWEAGSAGIRTMINRTISVNELEPIFNLDEIQTYSFQVNDSMKGNEKYSQMINLAKDFNNFEDTAKALKAMDVVVTVDTSVAHLAGALGVKTYLLLPFASDWRWFMDNKKTPWYESVEIIKQTDALTWDKQIIEVVEKLKGLK